MDIETIIKRVEANRKKVDAKIAEQVIVPYPTVQTEGASGLTEHDLHVCNLLAPTENESFLQRAYQCLLQRPLDDNGRNTYLPLLENRRNMRLYILFQLYFSGEGREVNQDVRGWLFERKTYSLFTRLTPLPGLSHPLVKRVLSRLQRYLTQLQEWRIRQRYPLALFEQYMLRFEQHELRFEQHELRFEQHELRFERQEQKLIQTRDTYERLLQEQNKGYDSALKDINKQLGVVRQDTLYQIQSWSRLFEEKGSSIASDAEETNNSTPISVPTEQVSSTQQVMLDAYYVAFEDANRGSTQEIRDKLRVYLPHLQESSGIKSGMAVLDIGCGRGEWLALLAEQSIEAYGVDMNAVMVAYCQEQGYKALQSDALAHLRTLENDSLAVISGFHIIEHVPFAVLFEIFREANRVLVSGGLIVFETPNPENVLVGSHTFYHDFTHRNPITPTAISFLATYHNFQSPEVLRLNPYPPSHRVPGNDPLTERVNGHLCGPQDFALIARKPELG